MTNADRRRELAVVILAAGKGKRMGNPDLAKVLVPLKDIPLLGHVLHMVDDLGCRMVVVIVGHQRETVTEYVITQTPHAHVAVQAEQLGTGHAVQQTEEVLTEFNGDVIILSGDVPLLTSDTLQAFVDEHERSGAALTVLTANVPDATGYGRIIRTEDGHLARIVEHKDANDEELKITEINSGIYIVDRATLFNALSKVRNDNKQQEYYLTDIAGILSGEGKTVNVYLAPDWQELQGINTPDDLEQAERIMSMRVNA